jgi:hypothetical protein
MLSVQYVALAATLNPSSGSTVVVDRPTGTVEGDLMVGFCLSDNTGSWTGDTGWTEVLDFNGGAALRIAYKVATASEPSSYTFTYTASRVLRGAILTYRNAQYDTVGAVSTTISGSVHTAPEITVAQSGSALIAVWAANDSGISWSAFTSGMTFRTSNNSGTASSWAIYDDLDYPAGLSGSKSATISATTGSAEPTVLLSLKPL